MSCFGNLTSGIKRFGDAATFKSFKNASEMMLAIFTFLFSTYMLYFLTNSLFTMVVEEGFFAYSEVIQVHCPLVNILIERELSLVALIIVDNYFIGSK